MQICTVVTQKGGSAKTTVAVNLLAVARQQGVAAIIIDIDPQGSATDWGERRKNNAIIKESDIAVVNCDYKNLKNVISDLRCKFYDLAIIDTPGADGPASLSAMQACNFALVPFAPTALDMNATLSTIERLASLNKRFGFVLTSCLTNPKRADEVAAILGRDYPVSDARMQRLVAYQDAIEAGLGVTESGQSKSASNQVESLWLWLRQQLPLDLERR